MIILISIKLIIRLSVCDRDGVKYVFVFEIQQISYSYLPIAKVTYLYLLLVFDVFDSNTGQIYHV